MSKPVEATFPLPNKKGDWVTTDEGKAKVFSDHLSQVFRYNPCTGNFDLSDMVSSGESSREVVNIIRETANQRKAPGYDLIIQKMISELPPVA